MKISQAFPSDYMKAETDIGPNGQDLSLVISGVSMADLGGGEMKPVLHFSNHQRGLVLNKTNANTIADIYGDDTDAWLGKTIQVGSQWVEFQGRQVLGLRVRPVFPNSPQAMAQQAQAPVQQQPQQAAPVPAQPQNYQQPDPVAQAMRQQPQQPAQAPQGVDPMSDEIPF